jgi:hypothetical protein
MPVTPCRRQAPRNLGQVLSPEWVRHTDRDGSWLEWKRISGMCSGASNHRVKRQLIRPIHQLSAQRRDLRDLDLHHYHDEHAFAPVEVADRIIASLSGTGGPARPRVPRGHRGRYLLVDAGLAYRRWLSTGRRSYRSWTSVTEILITHFHPDRPAVRRCRRGDWSIGHPGALDHYQCEKVWGATWSPLAAWFARRGPARGRGCSVGGVYRRFVTPFRRSPLREGGGWPAGTSSSSPPCRRAHLPPEEGRRADRRRPHIRITRGQHLARTHGPIRSATSGSLGRVARLAPGSLCPGTGPIGDPAGRARESSSIYERDGDGRRSVAGRGAGYRLSHVLFSGELGPAQRRSRSRTLSHWNGSCSGAVQCRR